MDRTDVSSVSSNDLLGIIADYLGGHRFKAETNGLVVLDDGQTCTSTSSHTSDCGFRYVQSQFPISMCDSFEFTVQLCKGVCWNYKSDKWPVCVGLVHPLAKPTGDGIDSLLLFSDNEYTRYFQVCVFVENFKTLERPWRSGTTVTVRVIDTHSASPSIVFVVDGTASEPISPATGKHTHVPLSEWIPTIGIEDGHLNSLSIVSCVSLP